MGKITVEVQINTFGTPLYSLSHPTLLTNTNQKKYLSVLGKFFRYLKREQLCSDCKKFVKVKSTAAD